MLDEITSKDISVVVQGAIDENCTMKCLKSIRKYLPDAEIILSTWEDSDVSRLDGLYDVLLLNKDPGAIKLNDLTKKTNNINRLILSTKKGIEATTRKYILKIRSDMSLKSAKFLKHFDKFTKTLPEYTLFQKRILAYPFYSLKFHTHKGEKSYKPFHISDWCYFGLSSDVKVLFDIEIVKEPEFTKFFICNPYEGHNLNFFPDVNWQYPPEQYIIYSCAKKIIKDLEYKHLLDSTEQNILQSELFIVNNFQILDMDNWGIYNNKQGYKKICIMSDKHCLNGLYTEHIYQNDYKKYCDINYKIEKWANLTDCVIKNQNLIKVRRSIIKIKISLDGILGILYFSFMTFFTFLRDFAIIFLKRKEDTND